MSIPRATARLQLHAGFTLDDACAQVPYYAGLGVSHLYLSPISQARDGSTHGYDVIDHGRVSSDLGGHDALLRLAAAAGAHGLGLIADIVPNHMAAHPSNAWWADVLRQGQDSPYSRYFDIDWHTPDPALRGKVLLPVLPESYGVSLETGVIGLTHDPRHNTYAIDVGGLRLPVAGDFSRAASHAPAAVCAEHDASTAAGRRRLHELLERQHYHLAWWRTAPEQINWRRFFEISELVGVRVEDDAVFDAVHALPLQLVRDGVLDGLRIDHIDGLAAPGAYLRRLRRALLQTGPARVEAGLSGDAYLIVEKILADDETLDPRWETDGTTGYDFMDQVSALLHVPSAQAQLEAFWRTVSGGTDSVSEQLLLARHRMLARHFPAERQALVRALTRIARQDLRTRDWTSASIDRVLTALLAAFPVYRTYADDGGRSVADQKWFQVAASAARAALGAHDGSADDQLLSLLQDWLDGAPAVAHGPGATHALHGARSRALRRFQQLTPPLAAKALEDTLFYRHGPLLSRNEVGSSPTRFALSAPAFHALCAARARTHPHAMLATATHDHKRGEDSRARLAVLSEDPNGWIQTAGAWIARLAPANAFTPADRYLLLQTLVGAWPLELTAEDVATRSHDVSAFLKRIAQWQQKALREAKLHTSWTDPDAGYEQAAQDCLDSLGNTTDGLALLGDIAAFALRVAPTGLINSLTQTLLRNTLPGVPDLYQGADLWDFSLVDPDNRRPVDYDARAALLRTDDADTPINTSAAAWRSGAVKQALIQRALILRARYPDLFSQAGCTPVQAHGAHAENAFAFLRRHGGRDVLVVAPRLCSTALAPYTQDQREMARGYWEDTVLRLPPGVASAGWRDVLSGRHLRMTAAGEALLADLLHDCPVALGVSI